MDVNPTKRQIIFKISLILSLLFWMVIPVQAQNHSLISVEWQFPSAHSKPVGQNWPVVLRFTQDISSFHNHFDQIFTVSQSGRPIEVSFSVANDNRTVNIRWATSLQSEDSVQVSIHYPGFEEHVFLFKPDLNSALPDLSRTQHVQGFFESQDVIESVEALPVKMINGVSVPADFPDINITVNTNPDTSGYIFTNNWDVTGQAGFYLMILKNDGTPVYYKRMPQYARDFKVQYPGVLSYFMPPDFFSMDSTYKQIRTYDTGFGITTDEHEFILLPNGNYLLIGREFRLVNMSQIVSGGLTAANVLENYVIERDANNNLVFLWRSQDHLDITDSYGINLRGDYIDYVHMNSIEIDTDNHLIMSLRHLNEVIKVNRETGETMWRLGGNNNQFEFINEEVPLSYQHFARRTEKGTLTIHDNGNWRFPQYTRAVEYWVDTLSMTATKVWQYRNNPDRFSWFMGNSQRLPSGNTLITWGDESNPTVTEVDSLGNIVYELEFEQNAHCYRSFRLPWKGQATAPYLLGTISSLGTQLLFNLFGDKKVKHYVVFADQSPNATTPIDTVTTPWHLVTGLQSGKRYYFRVRAETEEGVLSDYSNEIYLIVKNVIAGENQVVNSEFSDNLDSWKLDVFGDASAQLYHANQNEAMVQIGKKGTEPWHIEFKQTDILLYANETYRFEFDAYATQRRIIYPYVSKNESPWTDYTRIGPLVVDQIKKRFTTIFEMPSSSESNGRIVFAVGNEDSDVIIDNVKLTQISGVSVLQEESVPQSFKIQSVYPNPFNSQTQIQFFLPIARHVNLSVYSVNGQLILNQIHTGLHTGWNTLPVSMSNQQPSGLYLIRLQVENQIQTGTMIYLK